MKKVRIITLGIFVAIFALVLATNLIHWDETPLEQSIAALPLGLGLLLEFPFLFIGAVLTGNGSDNGLISYYWYSAMMQAMPFMAGAFYSGLFYLIATRIRKQEPRKVNSNGIFLVSAAVVLLAVVALGYALQHREGYGAINETNGNIPEGFLYTEKSEIPENFRIPADDEDIQQIGGMFSDQFLCRDLQKDAEIIPYWNQTGGYEVAGGWASRFAAVCGDLYVVVDRADYFGEAIYGPFSVKGKPTSSVSFGSTTMLSNGVTLVDATDSTATFVVTASFK